MYETRQPITTANADAHARTRSALAAAGMPSARYASAVARDVEGEMAKMMRENPGITEDEMLMTGLFDQGDIDRYRRSAAARAGRQSRRMVA